MKLLIINGPNMNLLGRREPTLYGRETYADLVDFVTEACGEEGVEAAFFQSNHEGAIVDAIQQAIGVYDGIVINPAAYTHTSIAILDALLAAQIPSVEVHLTDIASRESFRQVSITSGGSLCVIKGQGFDGYACAVRYLREYLEKQQENHREEEER